MIASNAFFAECLSQAGEVITEKGSTDDSEKIGSTRMVLTNPAAQLLAFFILFYVGMEVTTGGTVVVVQVLTTTSFHMCIIQPDNRFSRVDRDVRH